MRNFLMLTKINFKNLMTTFFNIGTKKKNSKFSLIAVILFVVLIVALGFGTQFYFMAESLAQFGLTYYIFFVGGVLITTLLLIMTIFSANGYLFKAKDYDLLSSLPIKNWQIVASKILSIILSSYIYSFSILIPCTVIYFIFESFNIFTFLFILIASFIFPIIPTMISLFIGLFASYISSKFKFINVIYIIFGILFFILYMIISAKFNEYISRIQSLGNDVFNNLTLKICIPNIIFFVRNIIQLSIFDIFIYLFSSIFTLVISVIIISTFYRKVNFALNNTKSHISKNKENYTNKSIRKSLLVSESKRYFSTPMYMFNSSFGLILVPFIPFLFKFELLEKIMGLSLEINMSNLILISLIFNSLLIGMTITTNSSISLEGKNFYLLKCLPISYKDIFITKILFNILICLPFIAFSGICYIILFFDIIFANIFIGVAYLFAIFLMPLIIISAVSSFGLFANLCFPKLDYINVVQVVKQSTSVFITFMPIFFINFLGITMYSVLISKYVSIYAFIGIVILFYLVLFIVSIILLQTKGKKLFNRI